MTTKYEIFNHFTDFGIEVAEKGKFQLIQGGQRGFITGLPFASFNYLEVGSNDVSHISYLKSQKLPFICLPGAHAFEDDFPEFMESQGLVKVADVVAQEFSDLESWQYQKNPAIDIQHVQSEKDLEDFDAVSSVCFGHEKGLTFKYLKPSLNNLDLSLFIARVDDQVIGCALISFATQKPGFYWDGVLPAYRNRGFATALTEFRMNYIKEKGCKNAYVQNMPTSISYYQRLGFQPIGSLPLYIWET